MGSWTEVTALHRNDRIAAPAFAELTYFAMACIDKRQRMFFRTRMFGAMNSNATKNLMEGRGGEGTLREVQKLIILHHTCTALAL
jgi:hypothetical protein